MKFSTIGTSWITESFIKAAEQTGEAELISVYSRSERTGKDFAEKHGANSSYTDIDEMLNGPSEFIYIASPNSLHHEHIMKCIEKGKHVFCEKPLVYTESQWIEINEYAKKHDVFVFEGHRHLFSPNYDILKNKLDQVGKVRSALLQFAQYSSKYDQFRTGDIPNVFSKEFAGGALMDLGVYPLSMAIDLFGEPLDVDYFPVLLSNGADGSGTLILTYEDMIVTIMCSKIAQALTPSEIHGESGTITLDHIAPIESISYVDVKTKYKDEFAKDQNELDMVYQLQEFVKMVEEKDVASHELWMERSRQTVHWLEAARKKQGILFPGE